MRRIAMALTAMGTMLIGAGSAHAAVLSSFNGTITYIADQGERNDLVVSTDQVVGIPVYTFKDDNNPVRIGGGLCELINGVGVCREDAVSGLVIDLRDRDDTAKIATAGEGGLAPPLIPALMIGGRGNDVLEGGIAGDTLKGNDGRDALRGRGGADTYKGGRGSDTLQTLDGTRDAFISCGEGSRDLLRADRRDPKPKSCELGGRNPSKPF